MCVRLCVRIPPKAECLVVLHRMLAYRVFQEKRAILQGNVPYVNLHRYNQTHLYQTSKYVTEVVTRGKLSLFVVKLLYLLILIINQHNAQILFL